MILMIVFVKEPPCKIPNTIFYVSVFACLTLCLGASAIQSRGRNVVNPLNTFTYFQLKYPICIIYTSSFSCYIIFLFFVVVVIKVKTERDFAILLPLFSHKFRTLNLDNTKKNLKN